MSVAGRDVGPAATEKGLLRVLARNSGRVVSAESLLRQVWLGRNNGDAERLRST